MGKRKRYWMGIIPVCVVVAVLAGSLAAVRMERGDGNTEKGKWTAEDTGIGKVLVADGEDAAEPSGTMEWIFYESRSKCLDKKQKEVMDALVYRWTRGGMTDEEMTDEVTDYILAQNMRISTSGIMSGSRRVFDSQDEVLHYADVLQDGSGIYDFIGVCTSGEVDASGRLVCYYWEAGVI